MNNHPALSELAELLSLPDDINADIIGAEPVLPSRFALSDTAASTLTAIGISVADIWRMRTGEDQAVSVNIRHAAAALNSFLFNRLENQPPVTRDRSVPRGVTGIHPTKDGRFFHTHGSFNPAGMCAAVGCEPDPSKLHNAVATWDALELEQHLDNEGHCGAVVRSQSEWAEHPHGQALAAKPVVEIIKLGASEPEPAGRGDRPLSGLHVLDLTRVLAGPTCARTLAEHGAEVLRIGAEHLPTLAMFDRDTGHGKRWAHLNLKDQDDLTLMHSLLAGADVFSEGYRPGVMARLGLSPEELHALRPGIIYVSINCYGHEGPFSHRPGWEQLGQSVSGMADEEGGSTSPRLVPAAACDYTTGYLAALGALTGLRRRQTEGGSYLVRVSLARTGMWYVAQPRIPDDLPLPATGLASGDVLNFETSSDVTEGRITHLAPVVQLSRTQPFWERPAPGNGADKPIWVT
ncbi:MAG: CoA transferase [Pseudomonadota bacterium]